MASRRRTPLEVLPALAAALLLSLAGTPPPEGLPRDARIHVGICRELLAGSTEGRQALVAGLWHAPLPTLAGLPAAALLPPRSDPLAARVTAGLALAWLLLVAWRFVRRRLPPRPASWAWLGFPLLPGMTALAGDPHLAVTVAAAATTAAGFADWRESGRLKDLVRFAFALALLGLCGGALGGWTLMLAAAVPLAALTRPATRARLQGLLLLGTLPLVYALAVWLLMSRLILFDSLYAWRFLRHGLAAGTATDAALPAADIALPGAACLFAALLGALRRRPATRTAGLLGLALLLWRAWLRRRGLEWAAAPAAATAGFMALLALAALPAPPTARREKPAARGGRPGWPAACLPLAASLLLAASGWTPLPRPPATASPRSREQDEAVLRAVERHVTGRTPYGRVFVCGYDGLALLTGRPRGLFIPCLDLHIEMLREAYRRQQLFLLVPPPEGAAALESPVWRYGNIHEHGAPRALYAGEWNGWRLYEIVTAPTADQIEEWRR